MNQASADALLCYGARLLQWSWDARGYGRGFEVSKKRWALFFERLDKTRNILGQCASQNPEDPTPWAYLIMVSTWFSDDIEEREYYFNQAVERDQDNWAAHMHMVIALSEKWGGNNEQMIAFAQSTFERAQEGSDLPIILLKAYIEYWKYLDVFVDMSDEAKQFIESEKIKTKAIEAYKKSLQSTNHKDSASSIFARYNASSWFWITKDRDKLRVELDILDDKIEDIHWRWAGSEGELKQAKSYAMQN